MSKLLEFYHLLTSSRIIRKRGRLDNKIILKYIEIPPPLEAGVVITGFLYARKLLCNFAAACWKQKRRSRFVLLTTKNVAAMGRTDENGNAYCVGGKTASQTDR